MVEAEMVRANLAAVLLAGIAAKVSPRVVPLWNQYMFGGSSTQNLSSPFGVDFTMSQTTAAATDFLVAALIASLEASPPSFPPGASVVNVDIPSRIGGAISQLGDPASAKRMDFSKIGEIPGNIAGDIGLDQTTCPVGAMPSPLVDARSAAGTADVIRNPDGTLTVIPHIEFTVHDTIDLCPGNCGINLEKTATVPMSRMEATGISGDVPFNVNFPAPPRLATARPALPPPVLPLPGGILGQTTATALNIREAPSTLAPKLGLYPQGTLIPILCQTSGTVVEGNPIWDMTDRGFVADRFVMRTAPGDAPAC